MLVNFAYGYPFEISNEDYIMSLLEASTMLQVCTFQEETLQLIMHFEFFQFLSIQNKCTELLLHQINVSNVVKLFTLADMFDLLTLRKQSLSYILYNFNQVFEMKDSFLQLPEDLLLKILTHPNLNCNDDVKIVTIANHWIAENSMSNDNQFRIFSSIDFNSLSNSDLELIASLQFVKESRDLSDIIEYFQLSEDVRNLNVKPCSCHCHNNSTDTANRNSLCSRCMKCLAENHNQTKLMVEDDTINCCNLTQSSSLCCWKDQNVEEKEEEIQLIYFAPEVLQMSQKLLDKTPRTTPLVPCIVGHLRVPGLSLFILTHLKFRTDNDFFH